MPSTPSTSRSTKESLTSVDSIDQQTGEHRADEQMTALATEMTSKVQTYLQSNLDGAVDEYKLLEEMNASCTQRYNDMHEVGGQVRQRLDVLNHKYIALKPYMAQIDAIDASSRQLETAAYALDAYVKQLEHRYKQLEKRGTE